MNVLKHTRLTLVAGLVAALAPALPVLAQEIRVLNWNSYGTDAEFGLEAFKEATGITVVHDYFTSEQEMITKLQTGAGAYDVVVVNAAMVDKVRELGLLQPLDTAALSNWDDLSAPFKEDPSVTVEGEVWGAPWVWGVNGLAYNTSAVDAPVTSAAAMWDPAFEGRLSLRDDAEWQVKQAALVLGQDMNHPEDLEAIKAKLLELKPQVKSLWASEDEFMKGMANGAYDLAEIWAGGAMRAKTTYGLPVDFVIPEDGAIAWFDTLGVPAGSKNAEAAAKFIDYMISPEFYVQWDTEIGAATSANPKALDALPEGAFNRDVMGDPAVTSRLHFMAPLSDDERQAIQQLWAEVKTAYAQ